VKRRMGIFFLAVALIAIVGSGTLAYTPRAYTASNVITMTGLDFEIRDTTEDHKDITDGTRTYSFMPGDTISDGVNIYNCSNIYQYIRVKPEVTINGSKTDRITVELDESKEDKQYWKKNDPDDGYYYYWNVNYNQYYFRDQADVNFFYKIHVDDNMGTDDLGKEISVKLNVESVQGTYNLFRQGWPTTN
jgi:hypothetical protein